MRAKAKAKHEAVAMACQSKQEGWFQSIKHCHKLKSCQILQKSNTLSDMEATSSMKHWLAEAYKEALLGLAEGGLPIGILC